MLHAYIRRALELKLLECVAKGVAPLLTAQFTLAAELVRAPLPRASTALATSFYSPPTEGTVSASAQTPTTFCDYPPVAPQVAFQAPKHFSCLVTVDRTCHNGVQQVRKRRSWSLQRCRERPLYERHRQTTGDYEVRKLHL